MSGSGKGASRPEVGGGTMTKPAKRLRLLFIHPGQIPPFHEARRNALFHLADRFDGDLVTVTWESRAHVRARREADRAALGGFGYHATSSAFLPDAVRLVWEFGFFLVRGLTLSLVQGRYDAVVAYGPFKTSLAAWIVARVTGARFVLDVPGNPRRSFTFDGSAVTRAKRWLADRLTPFMLSRADHLHLLYPTQIDGLHAAPPARASVFHNFVPLAALPPAGNDDFVMFLGYPWKLKGVDVLITAFRMVAPRHPGVRLVVMGHCPDRSEFEALAAGDPAIEFRKAAPHEEAMALMARCRVFVLPSRTEAMGRVLIEAMAMGKACIASAVDGIPHYLHDEETGLLFRSEDAADLARQLDRMLSDPALASRLGTRAREVALGTYSEEGYAARFAEMIDRTIEGASGSTPAANWPGSNQSFRRST